MHSKHPEYHHDEKCLNCGIPLIDKFCAHCGQKSTFHKDSFWHMAIHFAGDYFHYDGKFLLTVKTMFTQPGKITLDYINGKRARFLNPIQFYFFVTTIFFLFFLNFAEIAKPEKEKKLPITKNHPNENLDSVVNIKTRQIGIGKWTPEEATIEEYDSVQKAKPVENKDGFLKKLIIHSAYKASKIDNVRDVFYEKLFHNFPKVFFILLPFFALLLMLFFRKQHFYFVDHIIFSLHFHSFIFIYFFFTSIISMLSGGKAEEFFGLLFLLGSSIYLFLALKKVYGNSWIKTVLKQTLLFVFYTIGFIFSSLLLIIITFILL